MTGEVKQEETEDVQPEQQSEPDTVTAPEAATDVEIASGDKPGFPPGEHLDAPARGGA